jgi:hypothetical protein
MDGVPCQFLLLPRVTGAQQTITHYCMSNWIDRLQLCSTGTALHNTTRVTIEWVCPTKHLSVSMRLLQVYQTYNTTTHGQRSQNPTTSTDHCSAPKAQTRTTNTHDTASHLERRDQFASRTVQNGIHVGRTINPRRGLKSPPMQGRY